MVALTRRRFLSGLLASGATATILSPFSEAAAAESNQKTNGYNFYLTVTRQAFTKTYGDKLSPAKIRSESDLAKALKGTGESYKDNYIKAVQDYFRKLTPEESDRLLRTLTIRWDMNRGSHLLGSVQKDLENYNRAGRAPRANNSNPLFYALYNLQRQGVLNKKDYRDWLDTAVGLTHGKDMGAFHERVIGAIKGLREEPQRKSAPAAPKAPEKTF